MTDSDICEAIEKQNEILKDLTKELHRHNHLILRNQLISSLRVYMTGTPRVKTIIEEDYPMFIKVCDKCYHEILQEAITEYTDD